MIALRQLRPYTGDHVAPSPNHGTRRAPAIRGIVLHATEDSGDEAQAVAWLCSPRSRASCHLLVGRTGTVTRLVGDRQRAWHAGHAQWRGMRDVNSCTLGIEIANRNDGEPFTDAQYARVAAIVAHYCRQGVPLANVVGHGDIAAPRKTDPRGWDWPRFRRMVEAQLHPRRGRAPSHARRDAVAPAPKPRAAAATAKTQHGAGASKPAVRSRMLWLNGMTVAVSGSMLAAEQLDLTHKYGITLPEDHIKWAMFLVGVLSILLRLRTTRPLATGAGQSIPEPALQGAKPLT